MTSDRLQRRIDQFLDEADEAMTRLDWQTVFDRAQAVLAASPENPDGLAYLAMAQRGLASKPSQSGSGISPAMTPAQAPPQPVSFANGRYEVKRFLGEGGKKKVYLARDSLLDRDVAFALIKTEGLDEVGKERITREAQAMGRLGSHPHIVSVFDLGNESGQPFIVTELMGGGDVEGLIEKAPEHRVSLSDALEIALEVCRGLEFAHSKNIVHRDLKPGNVWLTSDRIAKIGDFGLAVATDRSRLTQSGMMVGTVSYMPPEQAMGGEVTPRSDLYSLGAMLYELVTGRPPFVGQDSIAIITQHLNAQPVNASHHRDDLPAGLDNLIMRLLEKDPERRPASAQQVREALEALRAGQVPVLDDTAAAAGHDLEPFRRIFVGRQPELEQLQKAFEAAAAYKGALAMVVGEPGIGKSTLCEHLATFATSHGGRVLIGHCYEDGGHSYAFLPFIEALRSYVLTREPDALRSELGTAAADVARLVPELRERLRIEPRVVEDTDAERWRLLEAVTSFLRTAASAQPLLLILEDLHWADKATLDQLLHLSRVLQGSRMLLVGTYRDIEVDRMHPLSGALAELRRLGSFLRVPLRGLTVDEVQRMASSLGGSDIAKRRAQAIQRETDGNPLYVQEVYRHLSEASSQAGGADDVDQVRVGIPEGIRDMIGKRLAGLSDSTNQVLGVAAVLGREFRMEVLQKVTDASEDAVLNAMEEATERNIVEEHTLVGQGVSYRFSHAFFREVLYGEISLLRRMRLHQQAGRVLDQVYGRRLDEHAGEVAEHFAHSSESADLRKALEYSELAARQAFSRKAYQEAATHLLRALAASKAFDPDNAAKQTDLTLALGEALSASGEPLRVAQNEAISALKLATGHNDRARARSAARLGIGATWAYGGPAAFATHLGSEWVQRVRDLATPGTAEAADVSLAVALSAISLGDFKAAGEQLRAGLNAARQHSDSTRLATLGAVFLHLVSPETWAEAASVYDELQRVATDQLDAGTRASLLFYLAEFAFTRGEAQAGEGHLRQLRDLAVVEANHPQAALLGQFAAVLTEVREGHLGDAVRLAQTTLNEARDLGNGLLGEYLETLLIVQPMLDTGRAEEADALLHDPGMSRWGIQQRALGCLTSASRGERDAAGRVLRELLTPMSDDILPFVPLRLLGHLTRVALLLSDAELAQRLAGFLATTGAACDGLSGVSFARVIGEAARLDGHSGPAKTFFERALRDVEGWRAESALVKLDLAEAVMDGAAEEREQAITYLDSAISELREMRMRPALERALGRRELLKA